VGLTVAKPFRTPNRRLAVDGGFALAKCAERPFLASSGGHEREGVRLGGTPSREVVLGWYLPSPERSAGLGEVSLDVGQVLQVGEPGGNSGSARNRAPVDETGPEV